MGDYHVHIHPHVPGPGDPEPGTFPPEHIERYVDQALERGVDEVCFTEHLYRMREAGPVLGEFWAGESEDVAAPTRRFVTEERNLPIDGYVTAVTEAKDRGLPVLLGLEVDFFPNTVDAVLDLLDPYPWDLLLGSVHWIGGFAIDVDDVIHEFDRRGVDQVYERYFALEVELARSGTVDVLAHADLVKNHGHRPTRPMDAWYAEVAAAAAESGTAVEVSSAGLGEPCAEIYPAPDFLTAFKRAGVAITMASDAHRPSGTAWAFDEVAAAARNAGYTERLAIAGRKGTPVPLPAPRDMVTAPEPR